MIPESKIKEARKLLQEAENIVYFFDDDCDGTTSFLHLYKHFGGRGIINKEGKELTEKFWQSVEYNNADLIVVLDIPMLSMDFIKLAESSKIPLIYIDHHPPQEVGNKVLYINPRIEEYEDGRNTSYWTAKITKDIDWLSLTGSITDYTFPEDHIKTFHKKRPDLFPKGIKDVPDAMENTKIGLLGSIIDSNVRGTVKEAMASVKTLTRIEDPDEILNQSTPAGKFIWKKYSKHKRFYDSIKSQVNVTKEPVIFMSYEEDNNSVSSALATEISSKNPEKVVIIARTSKEMAFLSIRCQEKNILKIGLEAMAGLKDARGGGHDHAIGASMPENQLELFVKKIKDII